MWLIIDIYLKWVLLILSSPILLALLTSRSILLLESLSTETILRLRIGKTVYIGWIAQVKDLEDDCSL